MLTGDSLFVGDIARPDLAIDKAEGAQDIFGSLRDKLLTLGDEVEVWPGHLGGSMCGGPGMDLKVSSTIGFERRHNPMLQVDDEAEFVARALAGLGPQPPNFQAIVELNRGALLTAAVELLPLTPRQVDERRRAGALLVDVRTDLQFDDAHVPESISIPIMSAGFGSRLAWLADRDQELVFIGRDDEDGRRAGRLALAIGLSRFAGYLHGGMTSWRQEQLPAQRTMRLAATELPARLAAQPELQVLDVRERSEYEAGHIPGAPGVPWHDIDGVPPELDAGRPVAVVCASGSRAGVAASLLRRFGAAEVIHVVDGGVDAFGSLETTPG